MFNFISIYIYIDAVALAALVTLATYLCSKNADWWWKQHVRVSGCSTYIQTCLTERVGWLSTAAPPPAVVKQVEERRGRIAAKEPPRESGSFTRSPSPFYTEQQKIMQQQQQQQQQPVVVPPPERPMTPRDSFKTLFAPPQTPERPMTPMTPRPMTPRPTTPGGRNVLALVKKLEDKP